MRETMVPTSIAGAAVDSVARLREHGTPVELPARSMRANCFPSISSQGLHVFRREGGHERLQIMKYEEVEGRAWTFI